MAAEQAGAGEFRTLGEQLVYEGRLISVAVGRFGAPTGEVFEREVVHHPGAVSVVPVLPGGQRVLLVRQYRAAVGAALLEIPAGKRDVPGEPPEQTARRELEEEVGVVAGRLVKLAEFYNSPGFSDEHSIVYLATGLEQGAVERHGIEERHLEVVEKDLGELPALVAHGELVDAKSIIGLCLAREALARERTGGGAEGDVR